jgi:hypothetical protein
LAGSKVKVKRKTDMRIRQVRKQKDDVQEEESWNISSNLKTELAS